MLEDAPPKKPPDKIVLPYGPKVQTIKIPTEATKAKIFIKQLSTAAQTPPTPYKYLTGEEHKKIVKKETNKKKDPCDKDMECKQDIEIREPPESPETAIKWEHKDEIAEAEGKIITANRYWTSGYIPETSEMTSITEHNKKDQSETEENQTKQQTEVKIDETYDAMQAFKDSIRKKPNPNPVSMLNLVRTIKENREIRRLERTEKTPRKVDLRPGRKQHNKKSKNA